MYFAYGTKETDYLSRKDKRLAAAIAQIGPIEREVSRQARLPAKAPA